MSYGQVYYGVFPPAFTEYRAQLEKPRSLDLSKARKLIAESGVKTPVDLTMYTSEGDTDQQTIATIVQGEWSQLGVDVSVQQLSASAYSSAVEAAKKTYSIIRLDGPAVPNAPWLLDYDIRCASAFNTSNYCDPKAISLLNKAEATTSPTAQQALWNQIVEIWNADSPRIPVYAQNFVMKTGVTHYVFGQENLLFSQWGS